MSRLPTDVSTVYIYAGHGGFRYTCRGADGKVCYDSERSYGSRRKARTDVERYWPNAKVTYE